VVRSAPAKRARRALNRDHDSFKIWQELSPQRSAADTPMEAIARKRIKRNAAAPWESPDIDPAQHITVSMRMGSRTARVGSPEIPGSSPPSVVPGSNNHGAMILQHEDVTRNTTTKATYTPRRIRIKEIPSSQSPASVLSSHTERSTRFTRVERSPLKERDGNAPSPTRRLQAGVGEESQMVAQKMLALLETQARDDDEDDDYHRGVRHAGRSGTAYVASQVPTTSVRPTRSLKRMTTIPDSTDTDTESEVELVEDTAQGEPGASFRAELMHSVMISQGDDPEGGGDAEHAAEGSAQGETVFTAFVRPRRVLRRVRTVQDSQIEDDEDVALGWMANAGDCDESGVPHAKLQAETPKLDNVKDEDLMERRPQTTCEGGQAGRESRHMSVASASDPFEGVAEASHPDQSGAYASQHGSNEKAYEHTEPLTTYGHFSHDESTEIGTDDGLDGLQEDRDEDKEYPDGTYDPVDAALKRDAARFFHTQTQVPPIPPLDGDDGDLDDSEQASDSEDDDAAADQLSRELSDAAEAVPSSQPAERAKMVSIPLVADSQLSDTARTTVAAKTIVGGPDVSLGIPAADEERVPSSPPVLTHLRPSQISTVAPTQMSPFRQHSRRSAMTQMAFASPQKPSQWQHQTLSEWQEDSVPSSPLPLPPWSSPGRARGALGSFSIGAFSGDGRRKGKGSMVEQMESLVDFSLPPPPPISSSRAATESVGGSSSPLPR
ncbi:hypothetical protein LTR53_010398, partial [Teratosphaeriaceae sp. CCFEE 6253]